MPHLHILTWPINSDEKAKKLLEGITSVVHNTLGSPLDKISISIQEISPSRWSDAGVVGTDPDFANKSRLKEIKDNHHEANKK